LGDKLLDSFVLAQKGRNDSLPDATASFKIEQHLQFLAAQAAPMTNTSDQTPKPETPTSDQTPKPKKIITVNQSPKPETTTSDQTPKTETTTSDQSPKTETTTSDQTPKTETTTSDQTPKTETTTSDQTPKTEPVGPIPPPDKPKQYRAIGLLKGKYVPGDEIERGTLIASDGTSIDAVVLGRLLGLVKSSRIDLEKEHLWVVYPRTRDRGEKGADDEPGSPQDATQESTSKTESPEAQPELSKEPTAGSESSLESPKELQELSKEPTVDSDPSPGEPEAPPDLSDESTGDDEPTEDDEPSLEESEEESEEVPDLAEFVGRKYLHVQMAGIWEPETLHPDEPAPVIEQKPDYFSIRGEVVYQNKEAGWLIVKVIQFSRRKPDEKLAPYFNLKLLGFLPERPVKNFWNLDVEREGTDLVLQDGQRIAYLGKRKPKKGAPKKGKGKPRRGGGGGQKPAQAAASPKEPPKLKKKQLSL